MQLPSCPAVAEQGSVIGSPSTSSPNVHLTHADPALAGEPVQPQAAQQKPNIRDIVLGCPECDFVCLNTYELCKHIFKTRHGLPWCPLCEQYLVPRAFYSSVMKFMERRRSNPPTHTQPRYKLTTTRTAPAAPPFEPNTCFAISDRTHAHANTPMMTAPLRPLPRFRFIKQGKPEDYHLSRLSAAEEQAIVSAGLTTSDPATVARSLELERMNYKFRCMACLNLLPTWTQVTKHIDKTEHTLPHCAQCGRRLRCYGPTRPSRHECSTQHRGFIGVYYSRRDYMVESQEQRGTYSSRNHYTGLTALQYRCVCGISFLHVVHLAAHLRTVHKVTSIADIASCSVCGISACSLQDMIAHLLTPAHMTTEDRAWAQVSLRQGDEAYASPASHEAYAMAAPGLGGGPGAGGSGHSISCYLTSGGGNEAIEDDAAMALGGNVELAGTEVSPDWDALISTDSESGSEEDEDPRAPRPSSAPLKPSTLTGSPASPNPPPPPPPAVAGTSNATAITAGGGGGNGGEEEEMNFDPSRLRRGGGGRFLSDSDEDDFYAAPSAVQATRLLVASPLPPAMQAECCAAQAQQQQQQQQRAHELYGSGVAPVIATTTKLPPAAQALLPESVRLAAVSAERRGGPSTAACALRASVRNEVTVLGFTGAEFLQYTPLLPPYRSQHTPYLSVSESPLRIPTSYVILYQCRECLHLFTTWTKMVEHIQRTGHCRAFCVDSGEYLPALLRYAPTESTAVNTASNSSSAAAPLSFAPTSSNALGTPPTALAAAPSTSGGALMAGGAAVNASFSATSSTGAGRERPLRSMTLQEYIEYMSVHGNIIGFPASPDNLETLVDLNEEAYCGLIDNANATSSTDSAAVDENAVVLAYQCPGEKYGCFKVFLYYGDLIEHLLSSNHAQASLEAGKTETIAAAFPMVAYRAQFTVRDLCQHFGFVRCEYCRQAFPCNRLELHKELCVQRYIQMGV